MCRWVAKHIVASGLAKHCEVQVSYAIGKAEPVSVEVLSDCSFLTSDELARRVKEAFSFKPADIIEALGLKSRYSRLLRITATLAKSTCLGKSWIRRD